MRAALDATMRVVQIDAPEWFARPDFLAALEDTTDPVATWHRPGRPVGEFSDVFTVYDHGDGPDDACFPLDIWQAITEEMARLGVSYAIVRIVNVATD